MKRRAALLLIVLTASPPAGGAEDAPSGRTLVERYTVALGGERAIRGRPSVRILAALEDRDGGGSIELLRAPPDRLRVEIRRPDGRSVRWGWDGRDGWVEGVDGGVRLLAGEARDDLRRDGEFYRPLLAQEGWDGVETLGWEEADGCWLVRLDLPGPRERSLCLDPRDDLPRAASEERAGPWGALRVDHRYEDWRRFGDLLLPAVQHQEIHGERSTIRLLEAVPIEEPPAAWFRPPGGGR